MSRLIFLNRHFHPDPSATGQILSDLAFHLAGAGREVHIITSRQTHDDPKANLDREGACLSRDRRHAREMLERHFSRRLALQRWSDLIDKVAA